MKRFGIVLLALLLSCAALCARAEFSVGRDVAPEDVTDFCYTEDASTYPPFCLRYRYYTENGRKLFYHETRQGEDWPLTEEDIIFSGTAEMTDEDWAAFLNCLQGGTVSARSEEVLDGDSGPWLYLYWTGDEGRVQEFSFASPQKQADFAALCRELAQNHVLTRLYYSRGGYTMPQSYEILCRAEGCELVENEDEPRAIDWQWIDDLSAVVASYDLEAWDGFRGSDPDVLDGEMFTFELTFADGAAVYASGNNAFPENYYEATGAIEEVFRREKMSRMAGIYRYEGEGFGGDFTITLFADGSYTFYEGMLSSFTGRGTWDVYGNAVYLTEEEETGLLLSFAFAYADGDLIYFAQGSDDFPYISVPDGGRFVRTTEAEQ